MTDTPRRALAGGAAPIPSEVIAAVGVALYGRDWVSALADALNVSRRTVQRWKDGDARITPSVAPELEALLVGRAGDVAEARRALKRHL